jgi:hypothetical protein
VITRSQEKPLREILAAFLFPVSLYRLSPASQARHCSKIQNLSDSQQGQNQHRALKRKKEGRDYSSRPFQESVGK